MKIPNKKYVYAALAVLALLVVLILAIPSGKSGSKSARSIRGINAVLTNEMSDSEKLGKMEKEVWNFMRRWQIRGMELCIMRHDSLLYAKGFGWADQMTEEAMRPGTIMRVASVSKLITAAGIMKLVENGELKLSDKVFGPHGILNDTIYTNHISDKKYYDMLRLNHFVVAGQWDSILSDRTARHDNFLMMNVRNLALSHKGQLLDKLFDYPQSGIMSLVASDDQSDRIPDVIALDSHIYYQMGNVAHSQNKAFDASVGVRFGSPSMMMRLIKTNLAWGAYEVAGKYISEMEKTWGYGKEAREMRKKRKAFKKQYKKNKATAPHTGNANPVPERK